MDWINRFREPRAADPAEETVINGAAHDAQKEIESNLESSTASGDSPEAIAEEIKRRQLSALVRYVAVVRAR